MNDRLKITTIVFVVMISIVFVMYLNAEENTISRGPFNRLVLTNFANASYSKDVKKNSYYIAGYINGVILLGNIRTPNELTFFKAGDGTLNGVKRLNTTESDTLKATDITIDSKYVYVSDLATGKLYSGNMDSLRIKMHLHYTQVFAEAVPITPITAVLRTIDKSSGKFAFTKLSAFNKNYEVANILDKQIDGLFCTDGMLHYSSKTNRLLYIYFYRNEFICMDTTLQVLYKSHTIDTITRAKLNIAYVTSDKSRTQTTPGLVVNRKSCVDDQYLYVNSTIMGKNESLDIFRNVSVIDVYDLKNGRYRASFYLPKINKSKLTTFKIINSTLIAIYGEYLAVYNLDFDRLRMFTSTQIDAI